MRPKQDPIQAREQALRAWFTRQADPVLAQIDGLDIGWGGVQCWATGRMTPLGGLHLDIACGYATFLAQLGWRFPQAPLVGLNVDFDGPHALARALLTQAGVEATLVQADARRDLRPGRPFDPAPPCALETACAILSVTNKDPVLPARDSVLRPMARSGCVDCTPGRS